MKRLWLLEVLMLLVWSTLLVSGCGQQESATTTSSGSVSSAVTTAASASISASGTTSTPVTSTLGTTIPTSVNTVAPSPASPWMDHAPSGTSIVSSSGPATTWPREDNIPFTLGAYVRVTGSVYRIRGRFSAKIISSRKELEAESPQDWEDPRYSKGVDHAVKYTDDYFKDRAIVLIEKVNGSGMIRDQYISLSRNGNQMTIQYLKWDPYPQSGDIANWRVMLEVKKEDVKDISIIYAKWQIVKLPLFAKIPDSPNYP